MMFTAFNCALDGLVSLFHFKLTSHFGLRCYYLSLFARYTHKLMVNFI